MGPTWGRQDPGGPHVGPMNLAIWAHIFTHQLCGSLAMFVFWWWHHDWLHNAFVGLDKWNTSIWEVIFQLLDIDFTLGHIYRLIMTQHTARQHWNSIILRQKLLWLSSIFKGNQSTVWLKSEICYKKCTVFNSMAFFCVAEYLSKHMHLMSWGIWVMTRGCLRMI